jgi:hypothetical protein
MKILTFLLLLTSSICNAQAIPTLVVNCEKWKILMDNIEWDFNEPSREELRNPTHNIVATNKSNTAKVLYYFRGADTKNFSCMLVTTDKQMFTYLTNYYNKHYTIVSSREWSMFQENGDMVKIKILSTEKGDSILYEAVGY